MTNDLTTELRGADLGTQYALHALRERRAKMAGALFRRQVELIDNLAHALLAAFGRKAEY